MEMLCCNLSSSWCCFGFKVTSDDSYDVDNKMLSCFKEIQEKYNVINVRLVQRIGRSDIGKFHQVTSSMLKEIDNNNIMMQTAE